MSKSNQTVNVAVVGLGFMGMVHLRAHLKNPNARVAAVCGKGRLPVDGVLPAIGGNIKTAAPIPLGPDVKVFSDLDELLADPEIDAVDFCTPTCLHAEQSISALRAGKHVLCEKPMARTSAAAREILRVAQSAPGIFMPAMCMRFWPGWSLLKQMIAENPYGNVLAARFSRLSELPRWSEHTYGKESNCGGALFDLHIHDTDFVQFLFGRPASVFSTGANRDGSVDHVLTQYQFTNGPLVSAEGSWLLTRGFNMSYTVHCERATLDFNSDRGAEALRLSEPGRDPRVLSTVGDGYTEEIGYFLECIRSGKRPEIVTARDGVSALEICEAEEKSVASGERVCV